MRKQTNKLLLFGCIFQIAFGAYAGNISKNEILKAYGAMQYPLARKLARENATLPEARLVMALTAVFDRKKQDLNYGLPELKRIYEDGSLSAGLRLQAGLAYARAAQTLQMRKGIYPEADGINYKTVYESIMKNHLNRPEACFAAVYLVQELFDKLDGPDRKKGFKILNNFIASYKGPKIFLGAVNIMLADQYVIDDSDYHKAVKHLLFAFNDGISNPRIRERTLFRIARTYQLKLNDNENSRKYYLLFLKEYPNSSSAPIVKRFLGDLKYKTYKGKP